MPFHLFLLKQGKTHKNSSVSPSIPAPFQIIHDTRLGETELRHLLLNTNLLNFFFRDQHLIQTLRTKQIRCQTENCPFQKAPTDISTSRRPAGARQRVCCRALKGGSLLVAFRAGIVESCMASYRVRVLWFQLSPFRYLS